MSPHRFTSLYEAAHSAELASESATAIRHYRELLATTPLADPHNPRLIQAKAFLASHPGT